MIMGCIQRVNYGYFIWFDPTEYGKDTLVAGDELLIKNTGDSAFQRIF